MAKPPIHFITRLRRMLGFTIAETMIILLIIGIFAAIATPSFSALYESIQVDQTIAELRASISQSQRAAIGVGASCEASILVQLNSSTDPFKPDVGSSCRGTMAQSLPTGISIFSNLIATPMEEVVAAKPILIASNHFFQIPENQIISQASSGTNNSTRKGSGGSSSGGSSSGGTQNKKSSGDSKNKSGNSPSSQKKESWSKWTINNCHLWNGCSSSDRRRVGVIDLAFGKQGSIDYDITSSGTPSPSSTGTIIARRSRRIEGKKKCIAISRRIGLTRVGFYNGSLIPEEITKNGQCTAMNWDKQ